MKKQNICWNEENSTRPEFKSFTTSCHLLSIWTLLRPIVVKIFNSSLTAKNSFSSLPLKKVSQQSMDFSTTFGSSKMASSDLYSSTMDSASMQQHAMENQVCQWWSQNFQLVYSHPQNKEKFNPSFKIHFIGNLWNTSFAFALNFAVLYGLEVVDGVKLYFEGSKLEIYWTSESKINLIKWIAESLPWLNHLNPQPQLKTSESPNQLVRPGPWLPLARDLWPPLSHSCIPLPDTS